jgi:hypothetical protein
VGLGGDVFDGLGGVTAAFFVGDRVDAVADGERLGVEGISDSVGVGPRVRDGVGSATDRDGVGIDTEIEREMSGRSAPPSHDDTRTANEETEASTRARNLDELPLRVIRLIEAHGCSRPR